MSERSFDDICRRCAVTASSAMVLEVSASPKPGNVHRYRDFSDTCFEHFLLSSVSVLPVFEETAETAVSFSDCPDNGNMNASFVGKMILKAVSAGTSAQNGGNTHFGTFVLMVPLVAAAVTYAEDGTGKTDSAGKYDRAGKNDRGGKYDCAGKNDIAGKNDEAGFPAGSGLTRMIAEKAAEICRKTTSEDAFYFYGAFSVSGTAVQKTPDGEFDLSDPGSAARIAETGKSLISLMESAEERDLVAAEWVNGFQKSLLFSERLSFRYHHLKKYADEYICSDSRHTPALFGKSCINTAVLLTFTEFLAAFPDTFIITKQGKESAEEVCRKAGAVLSESGFPCRTGSVSGSWPGYPESFSGNSAEDPSEIYSPDNIRQFYEKLEKLDEEMAEKKQNPGSLADICAAGLFLFLSAYENGGGKI